MTTHENPLGDAVDALQRGDRTPTEYAQRCLDRLEATEGDIHAFVDEDHRAERVRDEATTIEAAHDNSDIKPPFYGVPVGVKDIFSVEGLPTRAGSALPPEVFAGPEAAAVTARVDAGAVILGKTVTTEMAYFAPGPTRNPHDLDHTPGGSSSGSAAAVAAGEVPLALGSQTIGSITRPASFCGVVGIKPSYERIPLDGVFPFSPAADHVGYFTQDVAGAELAAEVLYSEWEPLDEKPDRPVVGVPHENYLEQADDEMQAAFAAALDALEAVGYGVRRTEALENVESVNERHQDMIAAEFAMTHGPLFAAYGDEYAPGSVDLIEEGRKVGVGDLVDARNGRLDLRAALADTMDNLDVDVWASPAAPGPAPEGIDDTGDPVMNLPWTHAGVPTVGLPAGFVSGLPVGVQFAGRFGDDERLLAWAADLETVL
jgi:Asp-tRNA(Asn)/Glu-tRNA(Gln) amidotransferase A subunit family amidase